MKPFKNEPRMSNEARIAVIEANVQNLNEGLHVLRQDIKYGFEQILGRFDKIDERFERIDRKFDAIQDRLWSNFLWLISLIIGLAGLIAHAQHWI